MYSKFSNICCVFSGVTCEAPQEIPSGQYTPTTGPYHYDDVIMYTCDEGWQLLDVSSSTCVGDREGFWTDTVECLRNIYKSFN